MAIIQPMTPEIQDIILQSRRVTRLYNAADPQDKRNRRLLLEQLLGSVGEDVEVDTPFQCDFGKNIHIGNHVIIGLNCTFVDNERIDIGDYVMIASDVQICTATHSVDPKERLTPEGGLWYTTLVAPVRIGSRSWIGGKVMICPGVTIGEDSVVGAGSVVIRDVPPRTVVAGVPARVIREI